LPTFTDQVNQSSDDANQSTTPAWQQSTESSKFPDVAKGISTSPTSKAVARIVKSYRRRQLSESDRARLIAQLPIKVSQIDPRNASAPKGGPERAGLPIAGNSTKKVASLFSLALQSRRPLMWSRQRLL
jgi:hypothetical protein